MKTQLIILGFVLGIVLIAGCQKEQIIGGDKDEHGCLIAAGYSWCEVKQKCLRVWEENCTEIKACTEEAKLCPDGTAVGRNGSNNCEFDPCPSVGMANPASVFCKAQGGESKIVTAADGSQGGVCVLPYGIECDEWAYFRGECPAPVNCTAEQKAAEMCTMEYMPVCGDDGVTYGNKCSACASKNIDSYKPEECPTKTYVTRDPEQCKVIKYMCIKGKAAFSDEFGCGCEPEVTGRSYVAANTTVCAATTWVCPKEQQQFFDETGCGCEPETTCGNGVCDPGEADACPACYYSTPPCLAPCTAGTCPEDCSATTGKLKANDCLPEEREPYICPTLNSPVCGWRNVTLVCPNPPCKSTYANKCTACLDSTVAYWTEGVCPA